MRRAAAEALRLIGNRLNGSRRPGETAAQVQLVDRARRRCHSLARRPDPCAAPPGSSPPISANCRRRRALADSLLERFDDPDPVVAMQAIKGLWRWWYWRADPTLRNRIEDA